MRYYIDYSTKNGLGKPAISLFFQGCDKKVKCNGCHNHELQSISNEKIDIEIAKKKLSRQISMFSKLHKELHVAFLGGEPLAKFNLEYTVKLSKWLREIYPDVILTIYTYKTISSLDDGISQLFNYGVLGEFDMDKLVDDFLPASSNQKIFNFKTNKTIEPIYIGEEKKYAI